MQDAHAHHDRLPPLNTLRAFEVTARHQSLTSAAEELALTPGAVSRQVKALEEALGVELFRRLPSSIELTDAGRMFLSYATSALAMVRAGAREISPKRSRLVLRVSMTFSQLWLIPRIAAFRSMHPSIDLHLRTVVEPMSEPADVAIVYHRAQDSLEGAEIFLPDRITAVCVPRLLLDTARPMLPTELLRLPMLLDTPDGWTWRQWCTAVNMPFEPRGGMITLDTDEAALRACLAGLGVAQATLSFVERELRSGELVAPCPGLVAVVGGYAAVVQTPSQVSGVFVDWLKQTSRLSQAAATAA